MFKISILLHCSISYFNGKMNKFSTYDAYRCMFLLVGQEIRERFSGAVEAFSRRNGSGHGDHSRHRSSDDVPSSKDVVSSCKWFAIFLHNFINLSVSIST